MYPLTPRSSPAGEAQEADDDGDDGAAVLQGREVSGDGDIREGKEQVKIAELPINRRPSVLRAEKVANQALDTLPPWALRAADEGSLFITSILAANMAGFASKYPHEHTRTARMCC